MRLSRALVLLGLGSYAVSSVACSNDGRSAVGSAHGGLQSASDRADASVVEPPREPLRIVEALRAHPFGLPGARASASFVSRGSALAIKRSAHPETDALEVIPPLRADAAMHLAVEGHDGLWLEVTATDVRPVAESLVEGALVAPDAADGLDLVHVASLVGVEELRVLRRAADAVSARWSIARGAGVASVRAREGRVEAIDAGGVVRIATAPMYAIDAHGTRRDVALRVTSRGVETLVEATLDAHDLAAPIVLDPLWAATGAMMLMRTQHAVVALSSGKVLACGGDSPSVASAEIYDPTSNSWSSAGSMNSGRSQHQAALLGSGKVLVSGGIDSFGATAASSELFDATSTTPWVLTGAMTTARSGHALVVLGDGTALAAGGATAALRAIAAAEIYDPTKGTWSATASMGTPRSGHTATLIPATGKVVVIGGTDGSTGLSSGEIYDPAVGAWTATRPMQTPRVGHTATLLATGKYAGSIVVAGGTSAGVYLSSVEMYDPAIDAWSAVAPLTRARTQASAVFISATNKLVVAGGVAEQSVELFDETTGAWATTGAMARPRIGPVAALLPGNRLIVAGGTYDASSEVFSDLPNATVCTSDAQCDSDHCVDGYCCDNPCTASCQACDVAGSQGTCTVVPAGDTPHGTRAPCGGTAGCASSCNGVAALCTFPSGTSTCGAPTGCAAGTYTPPSFCDGSGTCIASTPQACSPYACGATRCNASCTTDADCATGAFCSKGQCLTGMRPNGIDCTSSGQCASNHCVDGYCCATACTGACTSCGLAGSLGTCAPITATVGAPDPHGKCANSECALCTAGVCKASADTTPCGVPTCAGSELTTRHCSGTDGACLANPAAACAGSLACADASSCKTRCAADTDCVNAACDTKTGVCNGTDAGVADAITPDAAPVPQVAQPFTRCSSDSDCAGVAGQTHCSEGVCCDSACDDRCHACTLFGSIGKCTAEPLGVDLRSDCGRAHDCTGTCDGAGGCIGAAKGTMCARNQCTGPTTGSGAAYCLATGTPCPSDQATPFDCAPYICEPAFGACRETCNSSADCASDYLCDTTSQHCVQVAPSPPASGCSIVSGAGESPVFALSGALAALAWAGRRARKRG